MKQNAKKCAIVETECNEILSRYYIPYSLNWTLTKSSVEYFNHFSHFNDGSYDYLIQKAVTKTICMLSV